MSDIFHFEGDKPSFEDLGIPNGSRTWKECDVMQAMGYDSPQGFRKAIVRAMQACLSVGAATEEHFIRDGNEYRFTRFGCYLVAINGDPKKAGVAAAQAYFAKLADTFQSLAEHADGVDRLLIREEMTVGLKALSGTAKSHGVEYYPFFLNEGYRGMYNMNLSDLKRFKGLRPKDDILDRMGKAELAANLFRVTQTDEKIKNEGIQGQVALERAARMVGQSVRRTMEENGGRPPELLPLAPPIQAVKKGIKVADKRFRELDGAKKKRLPPKKP